MCARDWWLGKEVKRKKTVCVSEEQERTLIEIVEKIDSDIIQIVEKNSRACREKKIAAFRFFLHFPHEKKNPKRIARGGDFPVPLYTSLPKKRIFSRCCCRCYLLLLPSCFRGWKIRPPDEEFSGFPVLPVLFFKSCS